MKRFLCIGLVVSSACSDPACPEGKQKIGKTCFKVPTAEPDAGSPDDAEPERDSGTRHEDGGATPDNQSDSGSPEDEPTGETNDDRDAALAPVDAAQEPAAEEPSPYDASAQPDARVSSDAGSDAGRDACVASTEICDGLDNDCDGLVDENPTLWFPDCDLDGVAALAESMTSCTKPSLPECTSWTDQRPEKPDCNDTNPRYSPNVKLFESSNGPNETEEKFYVGDMNCDGVIQKPSTWEYWDWATARWVSTSMPLCTTPGSCDAPTACYENSEQAGTTLGCGNTEIVVNRVGCSFEATTARVRCL